MRARVFLAVHLIALAASIARADILPPDSRFIDHQARFEDLGKYPDYTFFVGWHLRFHKPEGEWKTRRLGETGEISMHPPDSPPYGAKMALAAVPKSQIDAATESNGKPEWFEGATPGVKLAELDASLIRSTAITDPRDKLWTVYRVKLADTLALESLRQDAPATFVPLRWGMVVARTLGLLALIAAAVLLFRVWRNGS